MSSVFNYYGCKIFNKIKYNVKKNNFYKISKKWFFLIKNSIICLDSMVIIRFKSNKENIMERRIFLKTLLIAPAIGMVPSISFANGSGDILGLEKIVTIIQNDKRLNRKVDAVDIEIAIESVRRMNEILIEAIFQTGVANDGKITTRDTRELNDFINSNYKDEWIELHGDDEAEGEDTGFHKVQGNGARTKLFGKNAINKVADSIYHLGFETHRKNRLLNEDGNNNASFAKIATWLDALLREDLVAGRLVNPDVEEVVGITGTGLDKGVEIIYNDVGLNKKISLGDMREGARAVNGMNELLLEAISATNASEGGSFTKQDMINVNQYLVANHADEWAELHGDDEANEETGFHKVQSDGAKTKLFGANAINQVCDGIHHLGFATPYKNRLVNEDGNKNKPFTKVAEWLNLILANELAERTL
ncbi:MAG: Spherulin-4 [uncultured Sulfurovum sp.]|uniref:Spherulin-4 n=1 Tax=uncultured Sulfurovum sp. TaxID=269237 RepID=A0A6S6T3K5_9BACT|nr:MAG: Spherulin-4 [uncultured Sulfurovum sp.]